MDAFMDFHKEFMRSKGQSMINRELTQSEEIHPDFIEKFEQLCGYLLEGVQCGVLTVKTESGRKVMCFELNFGEHRLCWDFEQGHGRCFIMKSDSVDGAGIFPL